MHFTNNMFGASGSVRVRAVPRHNARDESGSPSSPPTGPRGHPEEPFATARGSRAPGIGIWQKSVQNLGNPDGEKSPGYCITVTTSPKVGITALGPARVIRPWFRAILLSLCQVARGSRRDYCGKKIEFDLGTNNRRLSDSAIVAIHACSFLLLEYVLGLGHNDWPPEVSMHQYVHHHVRCGSRYRQRSMHDSVASG
jgi:hypothetical protein